MSELIVDLEKIQNAVRNSPAGQTLNEIERWSRFRSEESREEWLELLGPTAVVLSHQEHFVEFARTWLKHLPADRCRQLMLALAVHDIGEAKIGDVASPDKTNTDEQSEITSAFQLILTLDLEESVLLELLEAYQEVIQGDNDKLHYLFKALEKLEYLDTALVVFENLNQAKEMKLGWLMVTRVLAIDLPKVLSYASALPDSVGEYLREHRGIIDRAFLQSVLAVGPDLIDQYTSSLEGWNNYCQGIANQTSKE